MPQTQKLDNLIKTLKEIRAEFPKKQKAGCETLPDSGKLSTLSRKMDSLSIECAWMAELLAWRGGAGCGDHGEVNASKRADKRAQKVRKTLGYNTIL